MSAVRKLERLQGCASAADELLYSCFTHRTKGDFKIMSLVDKRSKVAQNLTEHNVVGRDDFADWLEYGASERKRTRPLLATYFGEHQAAGSFQTPVRTSVFQRLDRPTRPVTPHRPGATSPLFVESGVYRVGGDRLIYPRPKPILHTEISPIPAKEPGYNETFASSARFNSYSSGRGASLKTNSRDGIFHASFASQVTFKDQASSSQEEAAFYPGAGYGRFVHELPALLPIHEENKRRRAESPAAPATLQTVRAEVHSGELYGRFDKPPPFRPPPSPRRIQRSPNEPQTYRVYYPPAQRPLATSSPPRSRRPASGHEALRQAKMMRSPLLIAVRTVPSRGNAVEYSPQSQSSSSGFDSKNTSQQNHSSQSGSAFLQSPKDADAGAVPSVKFERAVSDPAYENLPLRFPATALSPILDASVDTHYEFDATLSLTETAPEASIASANVLGAGPIRARKAVTTQHALPGNIDARVQAMKQEFQEYRKRRARDFLESAC